MPCMTVPSATMRRLRRKAAQTRAALALEGGVAKKPSQPPPCSAPDASPGSPASRGRADSDTHARPSPFAVSCSRHDAKPFANSKNSSVSFRKGDHVRVRTPAGTLRTGQILVLWLHAVVVSTAEDEEGYLGVAYSHHKHPRSDPLGTVRVAKKDVKSMPPPAAAAIDTAASAGSSDVTITILSAHSAQRKAALRPTVAGKKPSMLKKMEGEMRSKSKAILDSWKLG